MRGRRVAGGGLRGTPSAAGAAASLLAALAILAGSELAAAHNGVVHKNAAEAAAHFAAEPEIGPSAADAPFPSAIGGAYQLVDQHGEPRSEKDPDGRMQLVFFGYASCEAICTVALPRAAEAATLLEAEGLLVTPVLITVDPEHDTQAAMTAALVALHPRFIGLTGDPAALSAARAAFQVESREVAQTPDGDPVFAHGSFIYVLDGDGAFQTLAPPISSAERIATLVRKYARGLDR